MTEVKRPARKLLFVSPKTHAAVASMQEILKAKLGYKVAQSETVMRGMQALQEKIDNDQVG